MAVDMMETLKLFSEAYRKGLIGVQRAKSNDKVLVHFDEPQGRPRWTYVRLKGSQVSALVSLVLVEPIEGVLCVHIGYGVVEDQRNKGLAKDLAACAIEEFRSGMAVHGIKDIWVEAIVPRDNLASLRVASAVLGVQPNDVVDEGSGVESSEFLKRIVSD